MTDVQSGDIGTWQETEPEILIPRDELSASFMDRELTQTFECGHNGGILYIPEHGITVKVDEGTISEDQIVQFSYGVTLYGSFDFPNNKRPISPILWICPTTEVTLKMPIQINLPHCLRDLDDEDCAEHGVGFAKANHNRYKINSNNERVYVFEKCSEMQVFKHSYGQISTQHCCYICIEANNTHEVALRAGYCLSLIDYSPDLRRHTLHVCATFLLPSCSKVLDLQFPSEEGYSIDSYEFRFDKSKHEKDPAVTVIKPAGTGYSITVAMEPQHGQISLSEIDFWSWIPKLNVEEMKVRHERKIYPPRIKMTIRVRTDTDPVLQLSFQGCKTKSGKDLTLEHMLLGADTDIRGMSPSNTKRRKLDNQHTLSKEDLNVVRSSTFSAYPKWKDIGIELDVPLYILDGIAKNYQDVEERFREMLIMWLKSVYPKPSWEGLVNALAQPTVNEGALAETLRQKYCPMHTCIF